MKQFIVENKLLFLYLLLAVVSSAFSPYAGVVVVSLLFLKYSQSSEWSNLFIVLYTVLFLSDSRMGIMDFAKIIKPFIALAWCLIIIKNYGVSKLTKTWAGHFIPFILFAFSVVLLSPIIAKSFQKTLSYTLILMCVPLFLIELREKREAFLRIFIFWLFGLLVLGFLFRFIKPDWVLLGGRYRGLMGNPNGQGILLVVNFLLVEVVKSVYPKIFSKKEYVVILIVFILSLLMCGTRSAILVFVFYFILGWIYRKSVVFGVIVTILLLMFSVLLLDVLPELIRSLGLADYLRLKRLGEGSGRIVAWNFAYEKIQENYFAGKGFGYTIHMFRQNRPLLLSLNHQGNAHNSFITFWLNTGIIGLVLYVYGLIRMTLMGLKKNPIMLPVFSCFMISANFESWLTASLNPYTIIFVMTMTILVVGRNDKPERLNLS
ncbi:MAG: O-antigen ligase family protein [Candidatus Margulisbacteria bacterium]|nr:O-antigen ligase family protein [Candidatus Margulisiibacteriota bacterium]